MGEAQTHHQLGALLLYTEANAVDFQLLGEALFHTLNHVVQQGTGQAVETLVQMLVIGPLNSQDGAVQLQNHVGVEGVGQRALGALHGDHIALGNVHRHICRDSNRLLTNSRHSAFLLTRRRPELRRQCAAHEPSYRS